jgi:adenine phosphoribosyltransferase
MNDSLSETRRYANFESALSNQLRESIRDVKDYPKPGIVFKDITPVLAKPELVYSIIEEQAQYWKLHGIEAVIGVEARGFILGSLLAQALKCSFIPVRKSGKLPAKCISQAYDLEYGESVIEIHEDSISRGCKTLIHDDLLATGGTSLAAAQLVERLGGAVSGFSFLINLGFLEGERKINRLYRVPLIYQIQY